MKYFVATLITKGNKEEISFYAKNSLDADRYIKQNYNSLIIKIVQKREPYLKDINTITRNIIRTIYIKKIKLEYLIATIRELGVMCNAEMPIHTSLLEIANSSDNKLIKEVFQSLANDINSGLSLSNAMQKFRCELGDLSISMVILGEKSGALDKALYSLADMLEQNHLNYNKFKKALSYPKNVLLSILLAFSILITYVIPQFKKIFQQERG